jgi:hypothetical protein
MNEARTSQEKFVRSRIQQSEGHTPLKYVGIGMGRLQILT